MSDDNDQLKDEVYHTFELVAKIDRLIEVSVFDILYAYLNLLLSFWEESNTQLAKTRVFAGVVTLLVYHIILVAAAAKLWRDAEGMHYSSLREPGAMRLLGMRLDGRLYLTLFSFLFVVLAAVFTAVSRELITNNW